MRMRNAPESWKDGLAAYGGCTGGGAVIDARTQKVDPAELGSAFPRTHHVLWLEFGDRQDFDDPRKEWRRLFSELLGTWGRRCRARGTRAGRPC